MFETLVEVDFPLHPDGLDTAGAHASLTWLAGHPRLEVFFGGLGYPKPKSQMPEP